MLNALRLMGTGNDDRKWTRAPANRATQVPHFRTADVGLDVLLHVVKNIYDTVPNGESREMAARTHARGRNGAARVARRQNQRATEAGEGRKRAKFNSRRQH
jgi:hypothetical protein